MAVPIQLLIQDQPPLVTIPPGATLQDAVGRMIEHDFSQLPVVENGRPYGTPASFVTSNSIARALSVFGTSLEHLRVRDAVVPARTISVDEDLFSKMDDLLDAYAVLVLNPDGSFAGIVTNFDTTQYFRRRAEDMLLVEDIETTLKDHVRIAYGGDEADPNGRLRTAIAALGTPNDTIREDCRKAFRRFCGQRGIQVSEPEVVECIDSRFAARKVDRQFDDLALSEYIQLARRDEAWSCLEAVFGVPDKAFLQMLDGVRKTRNKLMHFRPDIDAVERDRLRFCAEWFKNHPPVSLDSPFVEELAPSDASINLTDTDLVQAELPGYAEDVVYEPDLMNGESAESKYAPLAAYLAQRPRSVDRVSLLFTDVERIIEAPLPAAAREHRAWWANDATGHVQSGQWLQVNWRVVSINMSMQRVVFARAHDRERAYIEFFTQVQRRLRGVPGFPLHEINAVGMNWLTIVHYQGSGRTLVLSFARRQRLRVECYIDVGDAAENLLIFERMRQSQTVIESVVGSALEWERLDRRRACRVALYTDGSINDTDRLDELVEWAVENVQRFHQAISQTLDAPDPAAQRAREMQAFETPSRAELPNPFTG